MNVKAMDRNTKVIAAAVCAPILLFPLAYSVVCFAFSQGTSSAQPFLERPDPKYEKCVAETAYMRFHHMDLLKQIREDVVRDGKRGEIGLDGCSQCHTSRERFCDRCHNAVNLHPDCFGCHYYPTSVPQTKRPSDNDVVFWPERALILCPSPASGRGELLTDGR